VGRAEETSGFRAAAGPADGKDVEADLVGRTDEVEDAVGRVRLLARVEVVVVAGGLAAPEQHKRTKISTRERERERSKRSQSFDLVNDRRSGLPSARFTPPIAPDAAFLTTPVTVGGEDIFLSRGGLVAEALDEGSFFISPADAMDSPSFSPTAASAAASPSSPPTSPTGSLSAWIIESSSASPSPSVLAFSGLEGRVASPIVCGGGSDKSDIESSASPSGSVGSEEGSS
jgi:hypothetical protein